MAGADCGIVADGSASENYFAVFAYLRLDARGQALNDGMSALKFVFVCQYNAVANELKSAVDPHCITFSVSRGKVHRKDAVLVFYVGCPCCRGIGLIFAVDDRDTVASRGIFKNGISCVACEILSCVKSCTIQ